MINNSTTTVMDKHSVNGKKITIIGAARSGVAAAELLQSHGAKVFVTDNAVEEKLSPQIKRLASLGIGFETGGHTPRMYDADLIVISPGVPSNTPAVREAEKNGKRIVSELEIASWFCNSPIIGITGTNGKTTTTSLIGRLLHDAKRKHVVAGNIGNAFSGVIPEMDTETIAVLEVSSFQLDYIESFHPKVSVFLNLTPDHLDRYNGLVENYIAAKCRIFENQSMNDYLIYNYDDDDVRENVRRMASLHVRTLGFGIDQQFKEGAFVEDNKLVTLIGGKRSEIIDTEAISIKGIHNLYNAMASALTAQVMGVQVPSIRATLNNFKAPPHRLEFVREYKGVKYINDSKATNVSSVWYALQAYSEPIILLLGGRDKGNDYSKLYDLVRKKVKAVVAIGESANIVVDEFKDKTKVVRVQSMNEAVDAASSLAAPGDIVMLSPACASFDWFKNYEHRGDVFKQLVNEL
ncbi:MAG: UDP-N-acetylmuramoyl-L-alanine--D-glutamate ligase [Bacteroidota bacterium]